MSTKSTREKAEEEIKTGGPRGFAEMCRRMMSGEMPDCCGAEMRERMSRCLAKSQAKERK
jgi:hypothetical protein